MFEKNLLNANLAAENQFMIKDVIIEPFSVDNSEFQYHFTLTINLPSYCYPFNDLIAHIISWMQNNQPDALIRSQKHQQAIRFNVNYITDNQCDLTIELRLSERIKPTQKQEKNEFNLLTDRIILQEPLEKYGY